MKTKDGNGKISVADADESTGQPGNGRYTAQTCGTDIDQVGHSVWDIRSGLRKLKVVHKRN